MDKLASMEVFARVVSARGFSAAARELNISQATASKHVQMLETWIGARLLARTTRRLALTEAGRHFHAQCLRILEDLEAARQVAKPDTGLRGNLRISAPVAFGSTLFGTLAVEFMAANPEVSLDVVLSDRPVDVIEDGYDLAIRIGHGADDPALQQGLTAQAIAPLTFVVCAAPGYLAAQGHPSEPSDLARHVCLTDMRHPGDLWRLRTPGGTVDVHVAGRLKTDNGLLRRAAARAGAGVLLAPLFLVDEDLRQGRLVTVLDGYPPAPGTFDVVCPAHRAASPKVRWLISFLAARLGGC